MKTVYYLHQIANGKNIRIEEGQEITIGRAFDNTVLVDDASVSRHHAVIKWKKSQMFISDVESTNGTFVNKEGVEKGYFVELNFSDEVKIGKVAFKILDEQSVIGKSFGGENAPAKTMIVDADKINQMLNRDDPKTN